jgi:hypothetical protein
MRFGLPGLTPPDAGRLPGSIGCDDCLAPARQISYQQVEDVITHTLEKHTTQGTHWSTRTMAQESGLSQTAVSRIWRAFALQPHRTDSFKLSADPFFVEKVRDVVGLYMNPPDRALVLCIDEKSQVQALDRTCCRCAQECRNVKPTITFGTGRPRYSRLWILPPGKVIGSCHRRHRHQEFLRFLEKNRSLKCT